MSLIPNEHCESKATPACRPAEAVLAETHCDCWYEDKGCCACGTDEPNLVVLEVAP